MTYLISFLAVVGILVFYAAVAWAIIGLGYLVQRGLSKIKGIKKWYYRREDTIFKTFVLICIAAILFAATMIAHDKMFGAMFP